MFEDHRGVVGTAGPVADRQQSLAELLDREILPRLERPGRLLGPFDLPSATVTGRTKLALVWPSIAEGAHAPAALRPLLVALPNPRPFSLSLGSVPSPNLRAALRHRGLPAFGRPDWVPLRETDLWLVWLDSPLQVLGLVGLFEASGLSPRAVERQGAPRVVIAGPAAARLSALCQVYADAVLTSVTELDSDLWLGLARAAAAGPGWTEALDGLGSWLGPVTAPTLDVGADSELVPADPVVLRAGTEPVHELAVGEEFLRRPQWREHGRAGAYTDHVVVGAASQALRDRLGTTPTEELVRSITRSLEQETASLCLHFVTGLPGETTADRMAIAALMNQVVAAAPRGARQVSARLHELTPAKRPSMAELSRSRGNRVAAIVESITARRVAVAAAPAGSSLIEALLCEGPEIAPVLELVVAHGADGPDSSVAAHLPLWRAAWARITGTAIPDEPPDESADAAPTGLPRDLRIEAPASVSPSAPRSRPRRALRVRQDRWTRWKALAPQHFDYRIEYAKEAQLRFLGPSELSELLLGACERAQIPVCTTGIVQPRLRVGYGPSLGAGIAGDREYIDLSLERKIDQLAERLSTELPDQLRLHAVEFMPRCSPSMQLSRVALAEYEAELEAGHHENPAAREEDIARVRQWNRRIEEGLPAEAADPEDPIHQLCAIHWKPVEDDRARLEFTLDLRREGARCKPREVVSRALAGLSSDPRLIPLRRRRLLVVDDSSGRARLRTPLEQVLLARRRQRGLERVWAE